MPLEWRHLCSGLHCLAVGAEAAVVAADLAVAATAVAVDLAEAAVVAVDLSEAAKMLDVVADFAQHHHGAGLVGSAHFAIFAPAYLPSSSSLRPSRWSILHHVPRACVLPSHLFFHLFSPVSSRGATDPTSNTKCE